MKPPTAVRGLRQLGCTVLICAALSVPARAWESSPEFQSLTETEESAFEGPDRLTPEYFSDLLTYSPPPEWEYRWLERSKALIVDFGSLNTRRFLIDNRLKIRQPVFDHFEIRFNYLEEANLEREGRHAVIELAYFPWHAVGLAFYGEPSFRKPNDDTGLALLLRPGERHEIRIFNTFVDVTRLKYPDTPDTFIEPDLPYSRGIVGRVWSAPRTRQGLGDFLEYAARYDTPTRWRFTEANYEYFYWKAFFSIYSRRQFSDALSGAFRLQLDRKRESRAATGPSTAQLGSWFTNRLTTFAEATFHELGPHRDWAGTLGLEYAGREWITDQGIARERDLLPYARLQAGALGIGYIFTWHEETGSPAIGIRPEDNGALENRLNLSCELSFGSTGSLVLLASADLDELGTSRSWDGGSARLQLFF